MLDTDVSIQATLDSNNYYTVTVSPMYYIKTMLIREGTEVNSDLSNLLCALYSYYKAVKAY